jgi:acyl-CoA thioesterase-1
MASMARRYGLRRHLRKAILAVVFGFVTFASADAAPLRLLVLGDSLGSGYGLSIADSFQGRLEAALRAQGWDVTLIDGTVSGDTTAGGLARLDWAIGDGVDAALVELGGNDGLRGIDPRETEANLSSIIDRLQARHVGVLLSGMYAPPNLGEDYGRAFRAVFDRLGTRPGVVYDPFFLAGVAGDQRLNQPDHIHPDAEGVKIIVARLLPLVDRLLDGVPRS